MRIGLLCSLFLWLVGVAVGQDTFDCPVEFAARAQWVKEGEGSQAMVEWGPEGAPAYQFLWSGKKLQARRLRDGRQWSVDWPLAAAGGGVEMLRDGWTLRVSDGEQVRLRLYDGSLQEGALRLAGSHGHWEEVQVQPSEPLYFSDDFARAEMNAVWESARGGWSLTGPETTRINPRLSANPFALRIRSEEETYLDAGEWFWSNLRATVSVRPHQGMVGLCVAFRGPSQHLRLVWEVGPTGHLRLEEVRQGQARPLAEQATGWVPDQWYQLQVRLYDGRLEGWIDGELRLAADVTLHEMGGIALYGRGARDTLWDDVSVEDYREKLYAGRELGALAAAGPQWGRPTAAGYGGDLLLDVKRAERGSLGWGVDGAGNGLTLTWEAQGRRACLVWREAQEVRTLAEFAFPRPGAENRLTLHVRPGWVRVSSGADTLAEVWTGRVVQGSIGVGDLVQREVLRALRVEFPSLLDPTPPITEQFTREASMAAWSTDAGLWIRRNEDLWYRGALFGDGGFQFLPVPERFPWTELRFHTGLAPDTSCYRWTFQLRDGRLHLSVFRADVLTGETSLPPASEEEPLFIGRWGQHWVVLRGETPVWAWRDPYPLPARFVALRAEIPLELERVRFVSDHLYDDAFSHAPTEWWVQKGDWEVRARWACYPDWTWFGASDLPQNQNPLLWSKHVYAGDVILEAFAALRMNSLRAPGYRDPRDINLTLFGDGRDLASGYNLIFAGWANQRSAILKGEEPVVSNSDVRIVGASSSNAAFHRHWFALRAERLGSRLRFYVDDKLVGEYDDPQPLTAGRLALWGWNNGLMVARVRVWYQERQPLADYPAPSLHWLDSGADEATEEPVLRADFEDGFDGWRDGQDPDGALVERDSSTASDGRWSLKITGKVSGSSLAVWTGASRFDVCRYGVLRFDYRVPSGVQVNLYLNVRGTWYAIPFTSHLAHYTNVKVEELPPIAKVQADGEWHTAVYPLADHLRAHFQERGLPWLEVMEVERLSFASPQNDYLRCGFGGNRYGASFHIDRFEVQQSALVWAR